MIFILDDDAAVRDSIQVLLETEGYRTKAFESVAKFMEGLAGDGPLPACVILDVHLPDGDGRMVSAHLKAGRLGVPVILISGRNDGTLDVDAATAGALAFLEKPVSHFDLFDAVARAIGR